MSGVDYHEKGGKEEMANLRKEIHSDWTTLIFTSFLRERPTMYARRHRIYAELTGIVGKDDVIDNETELLTYCEYGIPRRETELAKGEYIVVMPDYAVYPETTEEVQQIVRLANRYRIPIIPYAGGSGLGRGPVYGGIIVDLKKMNRIIEIDEISHVVTVETGIYIYELEEELNRRGYELKHLPASYFCACVGGFIANRSAGRLSTKYGKIEHMILGMKIVLPTGEVLKTPAVPGHAVGPDLNHLFIGSGGTLGISTEATLKMYPIPEKRSFRAFLFPGLVEGIEAMRKIMQSDLEPCLARLYDPIETNSDLFKFNLVPEEIAKKIEEKKGCCYLVIGFDGSEKMVDLQEEIATKICLEHGAEDLGNEVGQFWWDHSLDDYYPGLKRPTRYSQFFSGDTPHVGDVFDFCVLHKNTMRVWKEAFEKLKKKYKYSILYGHFSHWYRHGTMMYPMVYIWNLPDDPKELYLAYTDMGNIVMRTAMKYGGAFQHHHGVGSRYGRYMQEQWGLTGFKLLLAIKKVLDPNNIMNPGMLGFEAF